MEGDEVVDGVVLIKSKNATSGYMGVFQQPRSERFLAEFQEGSHRVRLGTFDTAKEASFAYSKAKAEAAEAKAEAKAKALAAKAKAKAEAEVAQAVAEADAEEKATADAKEAKVVKRKAKAALADAKAFQAKVQAGPMTKEEAQLEVEGLQARLADLHLQIKAFELLEEMEAAEGEGEGEGDAGPADIPDLIEFTP